MTRCFSFVVPTCLAPVLLGLLTCCTGYQVKRGVDREVFGILRSKTSRVPNAGDGLLDITPPAPLKLDDLKVNSKTVDFLGDRAHIEKGARVITLADALGKAVNHNRTYLGEKEAVYLTALDLTLARHQFAPIFSASGTGSQVETNVEKTITLPAPPAAPLLPGVPATPVIPKTINTFVAEHTMTASGGVGFSALSRLGTRLVADLTTDFSRFFTGGRRDLSSSNLAVTLAQPLLRGAGSLSISEPLTQAERSVLYSIRDFTQYRKTFTIDTTTQYYRTLQSRDAAKNAHFVYTSFKNILVAQSALVDANRSGRTKSSLGLLQQAELSYRRRWISAVQIYEQSLDDLKVQLGLPVKEPILLEQQELEKLELIDPPGTLDEALETAMITRLDLWNARDERDDSTRRVKVAQRDLLPGLGLRADYTLTGDPGRKNLNLDAKRRSYSVGLDVDFNLDQKPERNALRAAQISEQRAERDLVLAEENVRKDVRSSWRNLEVARKQYELAQESLVLGEQRLQLEEALYDADRGSSRDLIDAQQDLVEARDQLTAALINHTLARIQLWKNMGILFIRKDGSWADVLKKETPKGNAQ